MGRASSTGSAAPRHGKSERAKPKLFGAPVVSNPRRICCALSWPWHGSIAWLYRLRPCGEWLAVLVGQALASAAPKPSHGRMIRIIDATTILKAGTAAKLQNKLWRIHSAFDL